MFLCGKTGLIDEMRYYYNEVPLGALPLVLPRSPLFCALY